LDADLGPKGLCILAFPSNEFGGQEPGDDNSIQTKAKQQGSKTFATFPVFAKTYVNGDNAIPLFQYLKEAAPGLMGSQGIKWNFTKFLADSGGHVLQRYATTTSPSAIRSDIQALIAASSD